MSKKQTAVTGANPENSEDFRSVFQDLYDSEEARELEQRADLLIGIQDHIKEMGYTQAEVANITGMYQPDVSCLLNSKVSRFKIDRLIKIAKAFDAVVTVSAVFPKAEAAGGK